MIYYPVYELGLDFGLSYVWMVQLLKGECPPRKVVPPASQNEVRVVFPVLWEGFRWARWADTSRLSFMSRTLCTIGDNCEQTTYGPRHGNSSSGLGPSESR